MLPTPPEGLHHWQPEDAPALEAAWADPEITRWNPPPDGLEAARWIAGVEQRWERRLALDLVVIREDGRTDRFARVAGEVGLSGFTADPVRAELGVWIAAPHRRSGLARRAVGDVSRWALTELALEQLWARTDPANAAAEALFDRLGWDRRGSSGGKTIWSTSAVLLR